MISPAKSPKKVLKKPVAKIKPKSVAPKSSKPPVKTSKVNVSKISVKPVVISPALKKETLKPALMTKKGKPQKPVEVEEEQKPPAAKMQTVVSMIESDSQAEDPLKAEKVSKVKPVKIERGNLTDEKAKWAELFKKYGKDKAVAYKMSDKFTTMLPLQHKILGWGFILTNENDRLEVLFETGIRMLISNYKT